MRWSCDVLRLESAGAPSRRGAFSWIALELEVSCRPLRAGSVSGSPSARKSLQAPGNLITGSKSVKMMLFFQTVFKPFADGPNKKMLFTLLRLRFSERVFVCLF